MDSTESGIRIAVDIGGTFTDVVVERPGKPLFVTKAPSTPRDPLVGIMDGLKGAADGLGMSVAGLLGAASAFSHATTRGLNAVLTRTTALTALLTTEGHPDILMFREGGRIGVFNHDAPYPPPYVPRALTYEVPERVSSTGTVLTPLDESAVRQIANELKGKQVEAVAVCFLWSMLFGDHERRVGEILDDVLPGVPVTLSHELNPIIREYWRASSATMDASLKPIMSDYLAQLERELASAGFRGTVHVVSSSGGLIDPDRARRAPIHTLRSGPAMAPYAGRALLANGDGRPLTAIVTDVGGTSLDISIVRDGTIPRATETWLGDRFSGDLTGFPSVDVRSVGAGGGSIASVDEHGLLSVGPQSAGAEPGPACYGLGGDRPTVTDACLILGYLDSELFLDGAMVLDVEAARDAIRRWIATPLGVSVAEAAEMVVRLATDVMARAIEQVSLDHGLDPRRAILVGGGGAAGLTIAEVGRELGCTRVFVPAVATALSAVGALTCPIISEYVAVVFASTAAFPFDEVNQALDELSQRCMTFVSEAGSALEDATIDVSADARYAHQVWEIETPVAGRRFDSPDDVKAFRDRFDALHDELRGMRDVDSPVEIVAWRVKVTFASQSGVPTAAHGVSEVRATGRGEHDQVPARRTTRFGGVAVESSVRDGTTLHADERVDGPAVITLPGSTLVIPPLTTAVAAEAGIMIEIGHTGDRRPTPRRETTIKPAPATEPQDASSIDAVTLAVIVNRFEAIVRAMQESLVRAGRSSVLNTARDCSCCILTSAADVLAMAESLPGHVVAGPDIQARSMIDLHPSLARGDCFLHNSPYLGNSHAADHSVLAPVISEDGRHRFTVFVKAHQADCGNGAPTTYVSDAVDVYQEGALIFPCVQVQEDYVDRADIVRMCRDRIRVPDQWWGDYLAMVGALRMGERKLEEFAAEVGWDVLEVAAQKWLDYSERRMRAAIQSLPAAHVTREVTHDPVFGCPDGIPVRASVTVEPSAGSIIVDLRDNIDCVPCGMNLTEATSRSGALVGVFNSLDPSVPHNSGSARCVQIELRENCVVGIPRHPASCSFATSNVMDRLAGAVQSALAETAEGLGMAEGGTAMPASCPVISGNHPKDGAPFITQLFFSWTGGAARPKADGWLNHAGVVDGGALQRDSVELTELRFPVLVVEQRVVCDSEGAGRTVGAPSARLELKAMDTSVDAMYGSDCAVNPARGVRGGMPGGLASQYRRLPSEQIVEEPAFARVLLKPGESLISISAAGGGYGPPWSRPASTVAGDVREGRVSRQRARDVYGVVFTSDSVVDESRTKELRTALAATGASASVTPT